jgi:diguanylate cyclase (GGDEF)-like protein/PAS domain S-box-containing protein
MIWLLFGEWLIDFHVERGNREIVHAFISGLILAVAILGIYALIQAILNFLDYAQDRESSSMAIYRSMLLEEDDGVFFKDKQGYYRLMNTAAKNILGLENRDAIGYRDHALFDPILAHKIELEDKKILQTCESVIWEVTRKTGAGEEIWLCKKLMCRSARGRVLGIAGYCRNITVLKVFQRLNEEIESRYQGLFNKLPYPVLIMDILSLKPYSFNKAMNELLGYSAHEFMNMRFNAHLEESGAEQFSSALNKLLDQGGNEIELKLLTRDKLDVFVMGYVQGVIINERQYVHMLMHDVTELRRSTEELISSEVKYRSLFEYASDAIIVVDINTLNILDANDVAVKILGFRRDDLMRMSLFDMEASSAHAALREQLNNLEIYNHVLYEHVIRNRKGHELQVEINAHKVSYGSKDVYQFLIRDISQRKRTEQALKHSEQRYREMFEGNQAIKLVIDMDKYVIEDANLAASGFYGHGQAELRGMSLDRINMLSRDKILDLIQQSQEQRLPYYTCPQRMSNGDIRIVEVRDGAVEIGGRTLLYSIIHDVTASKRAQDQLLLAAKMFDCTSDAVMITDRNNHIVSVNQAFSDVTGYQMSEVLNNEPDIILAGRTQRLLSREVLQHIETSGQWQGEVWHRLKNGETRPLQATVNIVSDDQGNVLNYIFMLSSVTLQDAGVCYGAEHYTSLTGLPNKAIFLNQLRHAIERNQRAGKQLAVMRIDLRDFSRINKVWSYEAGDQILRAIARRMKHNVRETDSVAHFGADDFALVLDDLADIQQIGIVAQKILSTLGEEYQIDKDAIRLEISIGIAITPDDGLDADELLEKAEYALRMAQQTPGNSFKLRSQHLNENAMQWLQIEMNLHTALKNEEFRVLYLPQISVHQSDTDNVEALIRWKTEQGLLLPMKFLNYAEQSGFINAIGYQMIAQALVDFKKWREQNNGIQKLSINLAISQITDELETYLISQCELNNIQPHQLTLDISEQGFNLASGEQRKILQNLQARGIRLCLDDFGRGGASLACMLECRIDEIKLDRTLTAACVHSADTARVVHGIMALAGKLRIRVVAEGVETAEEYARMRELGCEYMQGYYFCQPMDAKDVPGFVSTHAIVNKTN